MSPPNATADPLQRILAAALSVLAPREARDQAHAFIDDHGPRRPWVPHAAESFVT